jgi:hypothetical protein
VPERRTALRHNKDLYHFSHSYVLSTCGIGEQSSTTLALVYCTLTASGDPISSLASIGGLRIVPDREQLAPQQKISIIQPYCHTYFRCIGEQSSTTHSTRVLHYDRLGTL